MENLIRIKKILVVLLFSLLFISICSSSELLTTIKNPWGSGFFIINTATGKITIIKFLDQNHGKQQLIGIIDKNNTNPGKFIPCINERNPSAFLLDTESGNLYTFNFNKNSLLKVEGNKKFEKLNIGSYIPIFNKDGTGLFIINSINGECYWTNNGTEYEPFILTNEDN